MCHIFIFYKLGRIIKKIERFDAIDREGTGVSSRSILDAVRDPISKVTNENGVTKYIGNNATVILNNQGRVITTYPNNSNGYRCEK